MILKLKTLNRGGGYNSYPLTQADCDFCSNGNDKNQIPTPPNCPSCGGNGTELPPRPLRERGEAQRRGEGSNGLSNRNDNPPTLTLPLKGGREQVSNNSGTPQSLISSNHFTHLTHSTHFKKVAFTLAEILVTLAVIGIVAAMTIPTLVQNYKKKEYSTRLKKFYSTMQQVIKLSEIDNGPASQWTTFATNTDVEGLQKYWDTYFAKYLRNPQYVGLETSSTQPRLRFKLSDGTSMAVSIPVVSSPFAFGTLLYMNSDFSGTFGKNVFSFLLTKDGRFIPFVWDYLVDNDLNSNLEEGEQAYTTDYTDRDNVLRLCKANNVFCTQLLFLDGWEFKRDYPWKL